MDDLAQEIASGDQSKRLGPPTLYGAVGLAMFKADLGGLPINQKIDAVGNAAFEALARHTAAPTSEVTDSRFHLTDEQPFSVTTAEGERLLGSGWLIISEAEYAFTRPTADLGDDGDAEWLRNLVKLRFASERTDIGDRLERIVDRLILYREALGDAFGTLHYIYETPDDDHEKRAAAEARDKIDAVLRSGG